MRRPRTLVAAGVGLATVATSLALVAPVASIPIAQAAVVTIMPLGNSLTQGFEAPGGTEIPSAQQAGYRERLEDRFDEVGFDFDFVGTQTSGSARMTDVNHEGVSGEDTAEIRSRMNALTITAPDVVLLIGGTNDFDVIPANTDAVEAEMTGLLDDLTTKWPTSKVVVSTLPQFRGSTQRTDLIIDFNAALPGIVAGAGSNVSLVDTFPVITTADIPGGDSVHPDRFGYGKIADVWYDGLSALFPELSPTPAAALVQDSFTRPNADLGTAPTGQTWLESATAFDPLSWGVVSNRAEVVGGNGDGIVTVDAGISDVDVSADVVVDPTTGYPALALRAVDADNQLLAGLRWGSGNNRVILEKIDDGTRTVLEDESFIFPDLDNNGMSDGPSGTYDLRVTLDGDEVELWVDGVRWLTHTLSAADQATFGGNTRFGLRSRSASDGPGTSWDNFEVRPSGFVPSVPAGLIATTPASATVALDWNDVSDADGYRVYRSTGGGGAVQVADVPASTYTDTSVANGTTYTYTVTAYNAVGESAPSAGVTATPTADPDPIPGTPAGLSANPGNARVGLDWNNSTGADGYRVYRSNGGGAAVQVADVTASSYTDTNVANGTTYTYTVTAYNTTGESAPSTGVNATPSATAINGYEAIEPTRVIDTRLTRDGVRLPANEVLTIDVGSQYAGQALAVNLTAVAAEAGGFAKLWACDQDIPGTSSLNFQPGPATANGVITDVSAAGTVCVTLSQNGHVILDLFGVFPNDASFTANEPVRIADTRVDPGALLAPNQVLTVDVGDEFAGKSVAVNLTAVGAADIGFATLWACDQDAPGTSSLNFVAAQAMANGVITDVSAEGTVCVTLSQPGHAIVDLFGVFPSSNAFQAIEPTRVVDSRAGGAARLAANQVLTIDVGSQYANQSIAVNLTATNVADVGFATLWACDQDAPGTSSLNFVPNRATANGVITDVSAAGTVCVTLSQDGHAILDLFGVIPS